MSALKPGQDGWMMDESEDNIFQSVCQITTDSWNACYGLFPVEIYYDQ